MTNITYIAGNILRNAESPRILIHSCNCRGSWGGGIAYQLAQRYPKAEEIYEKICDRYGDQLLGKCVLIPSYEDKNLLICCLFTSSFGGSSHDAQSLILRYTRMALDQLKALRSSSSDKESDSLDRQLFMMMEGLTDLQELSKYKLEMPKINSGIFGVPWERTEALLKRYREGNESLEFDVYTL